MHKLNEAEIEVLNEALDDEYMVWSACDQVIADFGEIGAFVGIRDEKARSIDALGALYTKYGVPFPPNLWLGNADRYESALQACEAAVSVLMANADRIERLAKVVHMRPDVVTVLRHLQQSTQQRHLPVLKRYAARGPCYKPRAEDAD